MILPSPFRWAYTVLGLTRRDDAAADILAPDGLDPSANDTISAQEMNAILGRIGDNLDALRLAPRQFPDLRTGIDSVDVGEGFLVRDHAYPTTSPGRRPGEELALGTGSAVADGGICTDGRFLYVQAQGGTGVAEHARTFADDGAGVLRGLAPTGTTFTPTTARSLTAPNPGIVVTDGAILVALRDRYVVCWSLDAAVTGSARGAQLWEHDFGAAFILSAACLSPDGVFVAGNDGTDGRVRCLSRAAGTATWTDAYTGAQVYGIATDGDVVVTVGDPWPSGLGSTIRALDVADGKDDTGEVGSGASATGRAWDRSPGTPGNAHGTQPGRVCACDGRFFYTGKESATAYPPGIDKRSRVDGSVVATWDNPASGGFDDLLGFRVGPTGWIVAWTGARVYLIDPDSMTSGPAADVWFFDTGANDYQGRDFADDGDGLFSNRATLRAHVTGRGPILFRKVAALTQRYTPWRTLAVPDRR